MKKYLEAVNLKTNTIVMLNRIKLKFATSSPENIHYLQKFEKYLENILFQSDNRSSRIKKQQLEGAAYSTSFNIATNLDINLNGSETVIGGAIPSKFKDVQMAPTHYNCLIDFYDEAYDNAKQLGFLNSDLIPMPRASRSPPVSTKISKFFSFTLNGKTYNSVESRSSSGQYFQSLFLPQFGNVPVAWPGRILYFFKHTQRVHSSETRLGYTDTDHYFAFAVFFNSAGQSVNTQKYIDQGLEVWKKNYIPLSRECIVPLARIFSQVAVAEKKKANGTGTDFNVIIPLQRSVYG